jgi:survival-of-motor-neuron-related-splicing factor 30
VGDWIVAKYAGDGSWYPAKVVSVGGSDNARVYSVQFKGYEGTEIVRQDDTRPKSSTVQAKEREWMNKVDERLQLQKSKVMVGEKRKRAGVQTKEFQEQQERQMAWKSFATKTTKKMPLKKKSIFATDNVGRVGVIGSGKPMTGFGGREKHTYNEEQGG